MTSSVEARDAAIDAWGFPSQNCVTIRCCEPDLVLIGTPIDLRRVIEIDKPALRVTYRLEEVGEPTLASILAERGIIESARALA